MRRRTGSSTSPPQAGLTRVVLAGRPGKDHLLDSAGTGAAWLDYDRDGLLDCYVVNDWRIEGDRVVEKGKNALYRQRRDHTFEDVTDAAGVGGEGEWGAGVFVADYDGDGWPDMLVTNYGKNVLYRNLGNGRFENVAARVGLESPGWNTGAAWFDADGDGDLDVYVAQYIDQPLSEILAAKPTLSWRGLEMVAVGPFGLKGAPDHFFRNDGGRFVDATLEAGMEDKALAFGFSVRAADFDGDGDVDVYVANDSDPNYLYRNDGKGHFTEVATWTGCALDENGAAQAGMGLAVGDVTGDGLVDIFVNNFAEDFSTLYRQLPGGLWEDVSKKSGIGPATYRTLAWGTAFADLDNDGDLDIPVMNGHIYPQIDRHPELIGTYEQRAILLDNRGPVGADAVPQFVDVTDSAGPGWQPKRAHRGLAVADYDDDGDLDLLITQLDGPPVAAAQRQHGRARGSRSRSRTARAASRRSVRRCASRPAVVRSGATSPRATPTCPPTTRAPTSASVRPRSSTSSRSSGRTARRRSSGTCRRARTSASSSPRGGFGPPGAPGQGSRQPTVSWPRTSTRTMPARARACPLVPSSAVGSLTQDRIPSSREARHHGGDDMPTADSWVVVGLDNGGNKNNATVLDADGRFLVSQLFERPSRVTEGPDIAVAALVESFDDILQRTGIARERVKAVGLDTPGPASAEGVVSSRGSTNFSHPGWRNYDFRGGARDGARPAGRLQQRRQRRRALRPLPALRRHGRRSAPRSRRSSAPASAAASSRRAAW